MGTISVGVALRTTPRRRFRKHEVEVGGHYIAKVAGAETVVRIDYGPGRFGGWTATNLRTERRVEIKTAARLRGKVES
jgi:hypothetical protein